MLPSSVRADTAGAGTAAGAARAYATTPARPDTPWSLWSDMQNLSIGMGSILHTLTEGSMSIYWLMALHAIDTKDTVLLEKMQAVLVKGHYTNFFFAADTVVGLAVADTLQTRLFVENFLSKYTAFIYFGNITDPVERLDPVAYIAFLNAQPNALWYTSRG